MIVKRLPLVRQKLLSHDSYLIGGHRITKSSGADYWSLINGLDLWISILLDYNTQLDHYDLKGAEREQRIINIAAFAGQSDVILTPLFTFLDELDDWLLSQISLSHRFKGDGPSGLAVPAYAGVVVAIVRGYAREQQKGGMTDVEVVKCIHQVASFLKKLQLDRPDLMESAIAEFRRFEDDLHNRHTFQVNPETLDVIQSMNHIAVEHLTNWTPVPLHPHHGPGAVANGSVKSWYDKYRTMASDARVGYLLGRYDLGTQSDFNPIVVGEKSSRTSRFIAVPKTWKKLRGISAEPVELQFYQQGVLCSLDRLFRHDEWWARRIDLHNQERSGRLARIASKTGCYATIDLSAASDSVTLELVKGVFKHTKLLPWLLGTRSTHTSVLDERVELAKFAPMGSACCFPVECMVFALAAQVASDRTRSQLNGKYPTVVVFGDDIIIDSCAAPLLIKFLTLLGFEVNTSKSYWEGGFRESCGCEAYHGDVINPLRYKRIGYDFVSGSASLAEICTMIAYCNSLYERGLLITRRYLLERLIKTTVLIGKKRIKMRPFLSYTFSGEKGSIQSHNPSNYNKIFVAEKESSVRRDFQCPCTRLLGARLRVRSKSTMGELPHVDSLNFNEWLIRHQAGLIDFESRWKEGWLDLGQIMALDSRLPLDFVMTPSEKVVPWNLYDSL